MRTRRGVALLTAAPIAVAALAALGGCGGSETAEPRGKAMVRSEAPEAEENRPPQVERVAISPRQPVPGTELEAVVDAADPDGDPVRLEHRWLRNGNEVASGTRPTARIEFAKGDRIDLVVVASDGHGRSEPGKAWVTIGNRAPVLHAVRLTPADDVRAGTVLAVDPLSEDADGDRLDHEVTWWVNGQEAGEGPRFETEGLGRGDEIVAEVVARDGNAASAPVRSDPLVLGNTPPRIAGMPQQELEEGTFLYDFEAEDPDGDRNLRFWLEEGPAGMTVEPLSGLLRWTPDESQAGTHSVEVGVKDGSGDGSKLRFEVSVRVQESPAADAPPAAPAP